MRGRSGLLVVVLVGWFSARVADAQTVPSTVAVSARCAQGGQPCTGSHKLAFRIFEADTGGAPLWSEDHPGVTIEDGLLIVQLGSVTAFGANVFTGAQRFLEISVDGTAMSPRLAISSVPYAIRAGDADTLRGRTPESFAPGIPGGASQAVVDQFNVRARADCGGVAPPPHMEVYVNRVRVMDIDVTSASYGDYPVKLPTPTYVSEVAVAFGNDSQAGNCDHNLAVESVTIGGKTISSSAREMVIYDRGGYFDGVDVLPATSDIGQNGALRFLIAPDGRDSLRRIVRNVFNGETDENTGLIPGRTLSIVKTEASTALRVLYYDNFRVAGLQTACGWELLFNGLPCAAPGPITQDVYTDPSVNHHRGDTVLGYCSATSAGPLYGKVTITVRVGPVTAHTQGDCYTGWRTTRGVLEAEEVR